MSLSKLWEIAEDGGDRHAAVRGVAKSRTWLRDWMTKTKVSTRTFPKSAPACVTSSQRTRDIIPPPWELIHTLQTWVHSSSHHRAAGTHSFWQSWSHFTWTSSRRQQWCTHELYARTWRHLTKHWSHRCPVTCGLHSQSPVSGWQMAEREPWPWHSQANTHRRHICAYLWIWLIYNPLIPKGEILHIRVSNRKMKTKWLLCNNFKNLLFFWVSQHKVGGRNHHREKNVLKLLR